VTPRAQLLRVVFAVLLLLIAGAAPEGPQPRAGAGRSEDRPRRCAAAAGGRLRLSRRRRRRADVADDLRAQALDLALVSAFLVLAFVSFFSKSVQLKYVTLVAAVALPRRVEEPADLDRQRLSGCSAATCRSSDQPRVVPAGCRHAGLDDSLGTRLLRPHLRFGAFTQLVDAVVPDRSSGTCRARSRCARRGSSTASSAARSTYFLVTKNPLIYPYIEPFWMFGLHLRTPVLLAMLGSLLIASIFVRNLYCRFPVPLGAFLGVLSNLTVFRIKRWSECNTCKICQKACEWGAIDGPKILKSECVRCDDCERLYNDTKKCPHHLILIPQGRHPGAPRPDRDG
jgi:hypothetical protein